MISLRCHSCTINTFGADKRNQQFLQDLCYLFTLSSRRISNRIGENLTKYRYTFWIESKLQNMNTNFYFSETLCIAI